MEKLSTLVTVSFSLSHHPSLPNPIYPLSLLPPLPPCSLSLSLYFIYCSSLTRAMIQVAVDEGAQYVAHGATGKGNDQIRFELGAYALHPTIEVGNSSV